MLKNRFLVAFAFVGLLGLAACGGDEDVEIVEEPVVEEPAAPVTEPAPLPMETDTLGAPTTDTAAGATDTTGL